MIDTITNWITDDPINGIYSLGAIVIIGAIVGIYRSLGHCSYKGHTGRRVL